MSRINVEATAAMVAQSGLVTGRQLTSAGVARRERATLTRSTSTSPDVRFKSIYQLSQQTLPFGEFLIALTLAHSIAFITGTTAGRSLGVRRMPRASEVQLCVPHGLRFDVPIGVRLRQSRSIIAADWRILDSGLRIASWPRLAFDLAAELAPRALRSAIEQMLHEGWVTEDELLAVARRLCHPRRPGSENFQKALDLRLGRTPVESDPELEVLERLLARGVPVVPQHSPIRLPNRQPLRVDLAVPDAKWAVELDIHPSHSADGGAHDKRRDRSMHMAGWQVERVPPEDLRDLDALCDELAALYFARRVQLAA